MKAATWKSRRVCIAHHPWSASDGQGQSRSVLGRRQGQPHRESRPRSHSREMLRCNPLRKNLLRTRGGPWRPFLVNFDTDDAKIRGRARRAVYRRWFFLIATFAKNLISVVYRVDWIPNSTRSCLYSRIALPSSFVAKKLTDLQLPPRTGKV